MSDTPVTAAATAATPSSSDAQTPTSNSADQARIRKERREAKIRGGSAARLKKITGLNGGRGDFDTSLQKDALESSAPDLKEIPTPHYKRQAQDINSCSLENAYSSGTSMPTPPTISNDEVLRLMMRESNSMNAILPTSFSSKDPFAAINPSGFLDMGGINDDTSSTSEDPMMKILQQVMGGSSSGKGGDLNAMSDLASKPEETNANIHHALILRVAHAIMAITLGLYIAIATQFTGTKLDRERSSLDYDNFQGGSLFSVSNSKNFFYLFITIELGMLGSRYFLLKEDVKPEGIMGMLINFLQEPIRGYVQLGLRYMNIWKVLSQDALVCIFVLGAFAWWKTNLIVV